MLSPDDTTDLETTVDMTPRREADGAAACAQSFTPCQDREFCAGLVRRYPGLIGFDFGQRGRYLIVRLFRAEAQADGTWSSCGGKCSEPLHVAMGAARDALRSP